MNTYTYACICAHSYAYIYAYIYNACICANITLVKCDQLLLTHFSTHA